MKIIVLGTSAEKTLPVVNKGIIEKTPINRSRDQRDKRTRSSIAIELRYSNNQFESDYLILDASPDFREQLNKAGIQDKTEFLFLTSPRIENVGGLYTTYSPYLTFAVKQHWNKMTKCLVPESKRRVIDKSVINLKNLRIYPFPVWSGVKDVMTTAYKILDNKGTSLLYMPSFKSVPAIFKKYLKNIDIMILDGTYFDKGDNYHTSILDQLEMIEQYQPKKFYFTHIGEHNLPHKELVGEIKKRYNEGNVLYDNQVITINEDTSTMENIIKEGDSLKEVDDQTILYNHSVAHSMLESLEKGKSIEGCNREYLINFHRSIIKEMEGRDLIHHMEDNLDRESVDEVRGRDIELRKDLDLEENIINKKVETVTGEDYISIKGASVRGEEGAIDIVIKAEERNPLLEHMISNYFPEEKRKNLNFTYNILGADETYVPLFDLVLKPKKSLSPVLIKEFDSTFNIGDSVIPLDADLRTSNLEDFKNWASSNLDSGLYIEPRLDGVRAMIVKRGDAINIYIDGQQKDISESIPVLSKSIKDFPADDFILDGFLIQYQESVATKMSRENLKDKGYIKSFQDTIRFFAFDILWYNGRDLHGEFLKKRLEFLSEALKTHPETVQSYSGILVSTIEQLETALESTYSPGVSGIWAKTLTSEYMLSGSTSNWALFDPKL